MTYYVSDRRILISHVLERVVRVKTERRTRRLEEVTEPTASRWRIVAHSRWGDASASRIVRRAPSIEEGRWVCERRIRVSYRGHVFEATCDNRAESEAAYSDPRTKNPRIPMMVAKLALRRRIPRVTYYVSDRRILISYEDPRLRFAAAVAILRWPMPARRLRAAVLMAVWQARRRMPTPEAYDPETGELIGWKYLVLSERVPVSPIFGTPWYKPELVADGPVLRCGQMRYGIHAYWPAKDGGPPTPATSEMLYWGGNLLVEVRGSGEFVAGTMGWRAKRCRVVRVVARRSVLEALPEPWKSVPSEPWPDMPAWNDVAVRR